jgi:hypothetical protein
MLPYFQVLLAASPTSLHPAFRRYTCGSPVLLGRVTCPPLQSGLTWLGVLLSDLSWFYPGGQCHSCCGERAHV